MRQIYNYIKTIIASEGTFSSSHEISQAMINHFYYLFNSSPRSSGVPPLPIGSTIPPPTLSYFLSGRYCIVRLLGTSSMLPFSPKKVKNTTIALISKWPNVDHIKCYRHIFLCNTFYKIIAKILALIYKAGMPYKIHLNQSGFIQGRIATDNTILATEILSKFNSMGNSKIFCVKFDLFKAFDTIYGHYLFHNLIKKDYLGLLVSWI